MPEKYNYELSGHDIGGHSLQGYDLPQQALVAAAAFLDTKANYAFLGLTVDFNTDDCTYGCTVYYDKNL